MTEDNEVQVADMSIVIVCSTVDPASQNIKEHLLKLRDWVEMSVPDGIFDNLSMVYRSGNFHIVEVTEHHVYQDGIDRKIKEAGLPCELLIFASKHKSADGRRLLTAHFTGNPGSADFGGYPGELSKAAPFALRCLLRNMAELSEGIGFDVSMESTHHGPSDLDVPSVYAEIGSSEVEWGNRDAGDVVARAILSVRPGSCPVALGFGGGHYAARQSGIVLGSDVSFGHNFPNYQLQFVDGDMFRKAVERSGADLVYCDRKAMSSDEKKLINELADELGLEVLRESDIKEMEGVCWDVFRVFWHKVRDEGLSGRVKVPVGMKGKLSENACDIFEFDVSNVVTVVVDNELLKLVRSVDVGGVKKLLNMSNVVYSERDDATVSNHFYTFWKRDAEDFLTFILDECIKILKGRYDTEYVFEENVLYISYERFSPELARKWGVPSGPMFGKLAKGQSVMIEGNTIRPEMVHERTQKSLVLRNAIF